MEKKEKVFSSFWWHKFIGPQGSKMLPSNDEFLEAEDGGLGLELFTRLIPFKIL